MLRLLRPRTRRSSVQFIRFYSSDIINHAAPSIKKEPLLPSGKHLRDTNAFEKFLSDKKFATEFKEGDFIDSCGVMDKMAKYLDRNGGTGLAIDYGQDYIQEGVCTLYHREKKIILIGWNLGHKIIHPMCDPSTAEVDFTFLKDAILKESGVSAYGLITQKDFLQSLGIQARIEQLFRSAKSSEQRKTLLDGAERLMDPEMMGRIYKILGFTKESDKFKKVFLIVLDFVKLISTNVYDKTKVDTRDFDTVALIYDSSDWIIERTDLQQKQLILIEGDEGDSDEDEDDEVGVLGSGGLSKQAVDPGSVILILCFVGYAAAK
ncbi:hypothetical protein BD770DRAFT_415143 [Pilaira anomala]|nr:hypothetical protein BD770DRAFT_415143 [Pilaira anomala]